MPPIAPTPRRLEASPAGYDEFEPGSPYSGVGVYAADEPELNPPSIPLPLRQIAPHLVVPRPAAPFGVHRMALAGKAAGKDVGIWFRPSAAASALRMLFDAFPACGLGVSVATDGTLPSGSLRCLALACVARLAVGSVVARARVLLVLAPRVVPVARGHASRKDKDKEKRRVRLGLHGVNPISYETVKRLYTFPQSVSIAGGRPTSSYHLVGVQGDGLFYLDPHHSRSAVPLRPFVGEGIPRYPRHAASPSSSHGHASPSSSHAHGHERRSLSPEAAYARGGSISTELLYAHGPWAWGHGHVGMTEDELVLRPLHTSRTASLHTGQNNTERERHPRWAARRRPGAQDADERARSSMLLGFVCRDEAEWVDLRRRIKELPRTIFAIQDEPPTWPGADDDDDMLESISDPEEAADVSTTSHAASSTSHATSSASHVPAEVDTEEDPVAPVTSLPNARFDLGPPQHASTKGMGMGKGRERTVAQAYAELVEEGDGDDDFVDASGEVDDIEDDWVDPVPPPPPPPVPKKSSSSKEKDKSGKSKAKGKSKKATPVPVPSVHYPFPVSAEDGAGGTGRTSPRERERNVTVSPRAAGANVAAGAGGQRMHTAQARDGGRTQSGGVHGILTED
ncbi:hypothetical protein C8R45DRAFT_1213185 [Mycena sanguinolenta]|nr:hypothetical protein C8R45DRAFT_1213185 [Mycena sanguinolenta]